MKQKILPLLFAVLLISGRCAAMSVPHNNPYINPGFFSGASPYPFHFGMVPQHTPSPHHYGPALQPREHNAPENMTVMDYNNPFEVYPSNVAASPTLGEIKQRLAFLAPIRSNLEVLTQQRGTGSVTPLTKEGAEEYKSIMPDKAQEDPYLFVEKITVTLKELDALIKKYRRTKGSDLFFNYAEMQRRHVQNLMTTSGLTTCVACILAEELIQSCGQALVDLKNVLVRLDDPDIVPEAQKEALQVFFVTENSSTAPTLNKAWYRREDQYQVGKILITFKAKSHEKFEQLRRLKENGIIPFAELERCSGLLLTLKALEQSCIRCFGHNFKNSSLNRAAHMGHKVSRPLKKTGAAIGTAVQASAAFFR